MTPWRIGRGWSETEIRAHLAALRDRSVSFADVPGDSPPTSAPRPGSASPPEAMLVPTPGWTLDRCTALLGSELPGPPQPDGRFARVRHAVREYRFADPRITHGHYNPRQPLRGRDILVDVHALTLRFLAGLRVRDVLDRVDGTCGSGQTHFGIRLDTLTGHLLHGSEWIIVSKDHQSGAVRLRIEARWRPAPLPAWWMGVGFRLFGRQMQARWRRQAASRLRALGA